MSFSSCTKVLELRSKTNQETLPNFVKMLFLSVTKIAYYLTHMSEVIPPHSYLCGGDKPRHKFITNTNYVISIQNNLQLF